MGDNSLGRPRGPRSRLGLQGDDPRLGLLKMEGFQGGYHMVMRGDLTKKKCDLSFIYIYIYIFKKYEFQTSCIQRKGVNEWKGGT